MLLLLPPLATATPLIFASTDGTVGFTAVASLHQFEGSASTFDGSFDPEALTGQVSILAASLHTGLGPRDERMREFCLEVEKYPSILFTLSGANGALGPLRSGSGSGGLNLSGDLQIRDQHRAIVIPATYAWENGALHLRGTYALRWSDFGVPDPSLAISVLAPELTIRFDVLAHPPQE